MIRRPELLSPAGNWDCLRAAVANRADAIYFGLERFNARLRADNFHPEELPEIMGYLHRYDFQRLKVDHRLWKTDDPALNRQVRQTFARDPEPARTPVDMEVSGRDGAPLRLRVISGDYAVEADSELELSSARTSALTDVILREQLGHLGETAYVLRNFKAGLEGDVFIPIQFINQLRRAAISKLDPAIAKQRSVREKAIEASCSGQVPHLEDPRALDRQPRRSPESALSGLLVEAQACGNESPELITLCRTFEQIDAAMDEAIETVYIDFEDIRLYQKANGVLIRNLGSISFFRDRGFRLHGDFSLNVANPLAANFFVPRGLQQLTLSYDLSIKEVLSLLRYGPSSRYELTMHQHMPMFHMEHCVFAAFLSDGTDYTNCGRPCDRHVLKIREGASSIGSDERHPGIKSIIALFTCLSLTVSEIFTA